MRKEQERVWSRNIKDIYNIMAEMRQSVGLARRAGRHKHPHSKPEVLRHYKDVEIHQRRPGRTCAVGEVTDVDDFSASLKKLREGGLRKWVRRSTMERGVAVIAKVHHDDANSSDSDSDSDDGEEPEMTLGLIHAFDGVVVVDVEDGLAAPADDADPE
jgi:hypothetical protein